MLHGVALDEDALAALDARGYQVIDVLTHGGRKSATYSSSNSFIGIDSKTYWVKASAQQGLVAELVAGRVAAKVGAGPPTVIVRVPTEAIPQTGEGGHLVGVDVGSEDVPDTINTKDMAAIVGTGTFKPESIDPRSRTLVTAFRSWVGVGDPQVLVNLRDGSVFTIDHGDCFADIDTMSEPAISLTPIPSVGDAFGKDEFCVLAALAKIRAATDTFLLEAVSRMPFGGPWQSGSDRRLKIAKWLAFRRDRLEGVMDRWLKS
jgi:hypothetical protein